MAMTRQSLAAYVSSLKRQLPYPDIIEHHDDCRRALLALDPSATDVTLEFLYDLAAQNPKERQAGLNAVQSMLCAMTTAGAELPVTSVILQIPQPDSGIALVPPTHILAVTSTKTPQTKAQPVPIHGDVFAASCSMPLLPPAVPETEECLRLPVCPITVHSIGTLLVLREYMYTLRLDVLLQRIFPLSPTLPITDADVRKHETLPDARKAELAQHILTAYASPENLIVFATRVQIIRETASQLGMYHITLWVALDLAWDLVLWSLDIATETCPVAQSPPISMT